MTIPEPTPAEIEAAAREWCVAVGVDPDDAFPFSTQGKPCWTRARETARTLIVLRSKDKARIAELEAALRECLGQAEGCWLNHYGDNPEGFPVPRHIERARAALAAAPEKRDV